MSALAHSIVVEQRRVVAHIELVVAHKLAADTGLPGVVVAQHNMGQLGLARKLAIVVELVVERKLAVVVGPGIELVAELGRPIEEERRHLARRLVV
jgi:hypothetical protein|tara:strand:- start:1718 stop:2005 length:288 start_codon:yes stop_codon:yes gene_type:complete